MALEINFIIKPKFHDNCIVTVICRKQIVMYQAGIHPLHHIRVKYSALAQRLRRPVRGWRICAEERLQSFLGYINFLGQSEFINFEFSITVGFHYRGEQQAKKNRDNSYDEKQLEKCHSQTLLVDIMIHISPHNVDAV